MPSPNQKNARRPELSQLIFALVVAAIAIGIFASPAASIFLAARKTAASVNLGEIMKAYGNYTQGSSTHMLTAQPGESAHTAAIALARLTQLNDPIIWLVPSDPKLSGGVPGSVLSRNGDTNAVNSDFANKTLSYEVAANLSLSSNPPLNPFMTPVVWTRGLRDDGTWAPDSPWSGAGGHIAFLDGHVAWFNRLSIQPGNETLFKYGTNIPTTNIREALPPGTIVLSAEPGSIHP